MKKAMIMGILAIGTSFSATAATVYEKDGTKIDLKGDLQIQLYQKVGVDQDLKMDYDDLTVGFGAKHEMEDGRTVFGLLKMDWKKQAHGDPAAAVDEGFIGLDFGRMSIAIGRLDWGSDSFYVDEAVEIAHDVIAAPEVSGSDSLQARLDLNWAELILSGDIKVGDGSSAGEAYLVTNPKAARGLELGVLFQTFDPEKVEAVEADEEAGIEAADAYYPDTIDTVGVRVGYTINKIAVGADFSSNDDLDITNLAICFPITRATKMGLGYSMESTDDGDDSNTWYANVKHKVHKNTTVFAEIGGNDEEGSDLGYLAGMQVKF